MNGMTFHLDVVSSAEAIFSGLVKSLVVPTVQGEIAIYPRHAPLLAMCRPGQIKLTYRNNQLNFLYISGGMLEVHPKGVTLLADTVVRAANIDEAAALKAKQAAESEIASRDENCDCAKSYAELLKSVEMLKTLESCRRYTR